jgi:hypothetical protein
MFQRGRYTTNQLLVYINKPIQIRTWKTPGVAQRGFALFQAALRELAEMLHKARGGSCATGFAKKWWNPIR